MKTAGTLVALLSALGLVMWTACDSPKSQAPSTGPVERLSVGTIKSDLSSLIWVAKGRGYFSKQRLDIDIKIFQSGHLAIKDLFAGKLDLATATEFAAAKHGLDRPDFRIISILDEAQDQQLVARKDRGIAQPSDLRNKRIGVTLGTSADYYLRVLLLLEKMRVEDVQFVNLLPSEQVKAIAQGDLDAAVVWEPHATKMIKELGTNAISWQSQSKQNEYWLLLSTADIIENRSLAVRHFLAALSSAEDFIKKNDIEARDFVAKELEDRHLGSQWNNHRFRLGLNRPLLLKMEAELKWLKPELTARHADIPDLHKFIHFDALNFVEPQKVKIAY